MDRQAPMHTDRDTDTRADRQEDWRKNRWRDRHAEQQTEKAGREVARQTCTVGSRTGGWRRKETWGQQVPLAERESEIEGDRNRGRERETEREMRSVHGWLADC